MQLCRYLIETAGFPVCPDDSEDPLSAYVTDGLGYSEKFTPEAVEMYRLLLKQPGWDVDTLLTGVKGPRNVACPWWWACPDYSCVRLIKDEFSLSFSELSWEAQVTLAIDNIGHRRLTMPEMFLEMLGCSAVNPQVAQARDNHGRTALHMVARQMLWRDCDAPPTWVDFVRQLLIHGADIHQRCDAGDTPFTSLLRGAASLPSLSQHAKAWARLLQAAGIDLMIYGRNELIVWNASNPSGVEGWDYRVKSWKYGACADDWTVDSLCKHSVPVYEMVNAPGTWPASDKSNFGTICWEPQVEDDPEAPGRWSKVRDITLHAKCCSQQARLDEDNLGFDFAHEIDNIQDDCRAVVRLIQTSSRACHRPRSYSQPSMSSSREFYPRRQWLSWCHKCSEGQLLVMVHNHYYPIGRSCAKGIHEKYPGHRFDYCESIKRQMRRFQTRYRNRDELRSLPYAAYHPVYRRDRQTTSSGVVFKEP